VKITVKALIAEEVTGIKKWGETSMFMYVPEGVSLDIGLAEMSGNNDVNIKVN